MIEKLNSLLNIFDIGDLKFFFLVAKKKFKKPNNFSFDNIVISIFNFFK